MHPCLKSSIKHNKRTLNMVIDNLKNSVNLGVIKKNKMAVHPNRNWYNENHINIKGIVNANKTLSVSM